MKHLKTELLPGYLAGTAGALLLLAGCSHENQPAKSADISNIANPPPALNTPANTQTTVHVSEELQKACALPATPKQDPQFDFDEAALRPRGENILDDVASCLKDGRLKGRSVTIIGHADPRGTDEYNQRLGELRAAATQAYLVERGVPDIKLDVTSRGEQDATGYDEATWSLDRRVDLELNGSSGGLSSL